MLEHRFRFHGHNSVRYVYRHGRMVRSRLLSLHSNHNPQRLHNRVAIVIAKKVVKAAPKRNRIRRRLFEVIRLEWPYLRQGTDIVLTVQSADFLTLPFDEVVQEVRHVLRSADLLTSSSQDEFHKRTDTTT